MKFEIFGLVREEALQISSGEAREIANARSSIGAAGSVWCGEVDSTHCNSIDADSRPLSPSPPVDQLVCLLRSAPEIETLASSVPDRGDVSLVPAFAGLDAPHRDAYARGAIVGLTRGTTAAHIARAALEGIAYQVSDILSAMQDDSGIQLAELRVDGGACKNNLLMQFQADLLGVPVIRAANTETTAIRSLSGRACCGLLQVQGGNRFAWASDRKFEPTIGQDHRQRLHARWHKALERAKAWTE